MTNLGLKGTKIEKCDQNQEKVRELSGEVGRTVASGREVQPTRV